jgi:hypothetical protein
MAQFLQFSGPIVGATAGLHGYDAGLAVGEELHERLAPQLFEVNLPVSISTQCSCTINRGIKGSHRI